MKTTVRIPLRNPARLPRQNGAALVVALIMLVMVSLLAAGGFLLTTGEARGASGWSDRQRALFTAEGVLIQGEDVARALVSGTASDSTSAVEQAVRNAGTGYFVRTDGTVPALDPWPTTQSIQATASDPRVTSGYYMIVYEGMGTASGTGLVSGNGNANKSSTKPRFTIYAKAGGLKDATYVVLSSSKVLN